MHFYINRVPFVLNFNKLIKKRIRSNLIVWKKNKAKTNFSLYLASNLKKDNIVYSKEKIFTKGFYLLNYNFFITNWKFEHIFTKYYKRIKRVEKINKIIWKKFNIKKYLIKNKFYYAHFSLQFIKYLKKINKLKILFIKQKIYKEQVFLRVSF